jgi:prophage regulatory protein
MFMFGEGGAKRQIAGIVFGGALAQFPWSRPTAARLLRFPAVRERTGLSRSTIWRLERNGLFPRHRRISLNAVAWSEKENVDWILAKVGR